MHNLSWPNENSISWINYTCPMRYSPFWWWKERTRDGWNLRVLYILWITFFDWFPMQTKSFFFAFICYDYRFFFCRCLFLQKQPIWFFTLFMRGCSQYESNYISSFCVLNYFSFNYIMFHVISAVSSHFFFSFVVLRYIKLNFEQLKKKS